MLHDLIEKFTSKRFGSRRRRRRLPHRSAFHRALSRGLQVETLEDRLPLAVTGALNGSTLEVRLDAADDTALIRTDATGIIQVFDGPALSFSTNPGAIVSAITVTGNSSANQSITWQDTITISGALSASGVTRATIAGTYTVGSADVAAGLGGIFVAAGSTLDAVTGPIQLTASSGGQLTIDGSAAASGDITLTATDSAASGEELIVNSGALVQSTSGNVSLRGGDDVYIDPGATIDAAGTVTIEGDFGNADPGRGSVIDILGAIKTVNRAMVMSAADIDSITLAPDAGSSGDILLDGQGGLDDYLVQLGNLGGQVDINDRVGDDGGELTINGTDNDDALIVNATSTSSGTETITYTSQLEFLAVQTLGGADTIDVMPSPDLAIDIFGGNPTVAPGDTLNFMVPPLHTSTNPGPGNGTIVTTGPGDFMDVAYVGIESLNLNNAPVLDPVGDKTVYELSTLGFTATASDVDVPANALTFSLSGAVPAGASITPAGVFSWTPAEAQGPGTYTFDVVVTDNGTPNLSDTETITVTVDENPALKVADVSAAEGGGLLFTVTLDKPVQVAFTVDVTLADLTATGGAAPLVFPEDYDNLVAQLNFSGAAGETQQFTVATLDDAAVEATETFTVSLGASNTLVDDSDTATGTISDNDRATLSVGNATVVEDSAGATMLSFPVTLNAPVDVDVSVDYTTRDGTASAAGGDYLAVTTPATLTINAGDTSGTIDITVNDDATVELAETLSVLLNNLQAGGRKVTLGDTAVIDGEAVGDASGQSVSLSGDGKTLVIGAPDNGNGAGQARVYRLVGGNWTQLGQDIDGEAADDLSGQSVSLSSDGNTLAIGALDNDGNGTDAGQARVYRFDGANWTQLGQDIDGEAAGDISGFSVSLSSDGNTLGIGAYRNDGNGTDAGQARVYRFDGANWTQLGQDIDGEAAGDFSGFSVSLSGDGNTLVIGAAANDDNGNLSGQVRVYRFDGVNWTQLGQDIDGEAAGDYSGWFVSSSDDGNTLVIGAPFNDGNGISAGQVRVYRIDGGNWTQLGQDIDGEAERDLSGFSVSLSGDGNTLAIGAPFNNGNGAGQARVYRLVGGNWTQLGQDIDGEAAGDSFGFSVSLSGDGNTLVIGAPGNASGQARVYLLQTEATGTITDDDNAAVTVEDVSAAEGGGLTFTVTLDNAVQGAFTVDVTLADVTAAGGAAPLIYPEDYDNVVGQLNFTGAVGETKQFTVATLDDAVLEGTETFTVSLSTSNALIDDSDTSTGTITDNDNAAVTVEDVSTAEGGGLLFTVMLDNAVQGAFTVDVTLADVTATGGAAPLVYPEDYDNFVAQLNFSGTAAETQQFTVATLDDAVLEGTETFTASLSTSNALIDDSDTSTGTITDNDNAAVTVEDVSTAEGGGLTFTVTLDNAVQGAFTVDVTLADVTAAGGATPLIYPEDYDNFVAQLNFSGTAAETQQFTVAVLDDAVVEVTETFGVSLNASNALIDDSDTSTGTITDNDNAAVTVEDVSAAEDGGLTFTVTLDNAVQGAFTVDVTLADVTATGGAAPLIYPEDYDNFVTQLNFSGTAAETQQFTVAVLDDAVVEVTETFGVSLNASNALIDDSDTSTGTITDNDNAAVTVEDVSTAEDGGLTFTVTLDNAVQGAFTVDVTLADVTAAGGAAPLIYPEDYDNFVAQLNFSGTAAETQQFTVAVLDDAVVEVTETFGVSLNASNALIDDSDTSTGTITDNDNAAVTVEDVSTAEDGGLTFTVTLDNAVQGAFTVDVTLADVTATGGAAPLIYPEDYDNFVAQLNFSGTAAETQEFTVAVLDDAVVEVTETFGVSLNASNALIDDSDTSTGTITDNDNAAVTVEDVSTAEGGGLLFTVTLDNAVQGAFTVDVTLADVTAAGGAAPLIYPEDYDNFVAQLNFSGTAAETQQFTVAVLDDAVVEVTETFGVSLNASNALVDDSDMSTGTITDNDSLLVEFSQSTGMDAESSGGNLPQLLVTGTIQTGHNVTIDAAVVGGTAIGGGDDYNDPTTATIPAGTYDATAFAITGLSVTPDTLIESDETIDLGSLTGSQLQVGDANGDGTTQPSTRYTIVDDDLQRVQTSLVVTDTLLTITDSVPAGKDDQLELTVVGNSLVITDGKNNVIGDFTDNTTGSVADVPLASISGVEINLSGGDDQLSINFSGAPSDFNLSLTVNGGAGLDTLTFSGPTPLGSGELSTNGGVEDIFVNGLIRTVGGAVMLTATHSIEVNANIDTGDMAEVRLTAEEHDILGNCSLIRAGAADVHLAASTGIAGVRVQTTGDVTLDGGSGGIVGCPGGQLAVSANTLTLIADASVGTALRIAGQTTVTTPFPTSVNAIQGTVGGLGIFLANDGPLTDRVVLVDPSPLGVRDVRSVAPSGSSEGEGAPLQNAVNGLDVNNDGAVSPVDALAVVNYLNAMEVHAEGPSSVRGMLYVDVNGDYAVSPVDALAVINYLNWARPLAAEGESSPLDQVETEPLSHPSADNLIIALGSNVAFQRVPHVSTTAVTRQGSNETRGWLSSSHPIPRVEEVEPEHGPQLRRSFPIGEADDELERLISQIAPDVGVVWGNFDGTTGAARQ